MAAKLHWRYFGRTGGPHIEFCDHNADLGYIFIYIIMIAKTKIYY